MTAKPRKPLLVNFAWAAVLLAVLCAVYVSSYLACCWLAARGTIGGDTARICVTAFYPLQRYRQSDLPGGETLNRLTWRCTLRGFEERADEPLHHLGTEHITQ